MKPAISIFILILLAGCAGEGRYYDCESDDKNCMTLPVMVGSDKNGVEVSVVTGRKHPLDTELPTVFITYDANPREIYKLKHLDVRLVVDGREIEADSQEYTATYISDASAALRFENKVCCAGLGERLGISFDPNGFRNSNEFQPVKIVVKKDFDSLGRLPERMTLVLTATTDKGTTEMERTVVLRSR